MIEKTDWVNGWQVRQGRDSGFGVYDLHGMVAGPFGTREEALAEAIKLPKPGPVKKPPSL